MRAADAIIRCLQEEKVKVVFGYPGGAVLPLYEALRNSNIRHVLVRHEQAAAHSASGYARAVRDVGVAIATSGPGATNLITGIATAYMDSIPMVILTGQVRTNLMGRDVFQEVDITGATEPFTKHNYLVKDAQEIPRIMKEAFHIARTGRPGPVLIDLPVDIQNTEIDFQYPNQVDILGYKPTVRGHIGQIKRALRKLKSAKKPLLCVGGGVIRANAEDELERFISKAKLPVVHTLMGTGALPSDHSYNFGMIGSHGFKAANQAVNIADLLVVIGARIADRATAGPGLFARNAKLVHIDIDPAEIGKNIGAFIPVVGDAKNILEQLTEGIDELNTSGWFAELESYRNKELEKLIPSETVVNPKLALQALSKLLDEDAIITADVGQNQIWAARNLTFPKRRMFLTSGGFGTMGYSLPAAVGAKIAQPKRQVVAIVGDGGFQMSMSELGTIAQNNLDLIIILFNNCQLGMVWELQDRGYGSSHGIALDGNPDFQMLAKSYGFKAYKVTDNDTFEQVVKNTFGESGVTVIECIVNPKESTL